MKQSTNILPHVFPISPHFPHFPLFSFSTLLSTPNPHPQGAQKVCFFLLLLQSYLQFFTEHQRLLQTPPTFPALAHLAIRLCANFQKREVSGHAHVCMNTMHTIRYFTLVAYGQILRAGFFATQYTDKGGEEVSAEGCSMVT